MKIGMLLDTPFPPDVRVENEAHSLIGAGHEIHIFTVAFGDEAAQEKWHGIHIHRLRIKKQLFNKMKAAALRTPLYHRLWKKFVMDRLGHHSLDAIHVHDLPLAKVGYRLAERWQIPWILDLHENYPALLEASGLIKGILGKYCFAPNLWKKYEHWAVSKADHVVVVIDEAKDRLSAFNNKMTVVSNTPRLEEFKQSTMKPPDQPFNLLYAGAFGPHRGLETLIKALHQVQEQINHIKLHLAGTGKHATLLKKLTDGLGLTDSVHFHGWVTLEKMVELIDQSDICVVPHLRSEHTDSTIPHKLFQYMAMGKPVIVSDCIPLKRIVEDVACGFVYEDGNVDDLAGAIIRLKDAEVRKKLGIKGRNGVTQRYHWDIDAQRLLNIYNALENNKSTA